MNAPLKAPKQPQLPGVEFLERRMLPVGWLFVDFEKYQRTFSRPHAVKIAQNFNPESFGILKVAQRGNNRYAIIDGQHRWEAAKILKIPTVPCEIVPNSSAEKEAVIFTNSNQTKQLTNFDRLKASIAAKNSYALELKSIVESHGFRLGKRSGKGIIAAVYACKMVFAESSETLDKVLEIIQSIWADRPMATHGYLIQGLATLLNWVEKNKFEMKPGRLAEVLAKKPPVHFLAIGNTLPGYSTKASQHRATAVLMAAAYNHGLSQKNRIPIDKLIGA